MHNIDFVQDLCFIFTMVEIQQLLGPNGFITSIERDNEQIEIYWAGRLYYSYNKEDKFAKNLGIVLMNQLHVLQNTICDLFQISRNTITNLTKIYIKDGPNGLINYKQGPQALEKELKQFIISKYLELNKERGYQKTILNMIIKKTKVGEFKKSISRSMLQKVIKAYKREREEEQQKQIKEQAEREAKKKEKEEKRKNDIQEEEPELDFSNQMEEKEEICTTHGGSAAIIVLLNEFGIADAIPEQENENVYSNSELALTYAVLNAAEIITVEQTFKNLSSYEMGGIIGRKRLPSLSTYRNRIPEIIKEIDMRDVILKSAKHMYKYNGFSRDVYIDGHFMPYYGRNKILYNYCSQRRLAMHGREYFFVHDSEGEPVYATISDGYRDMRHYIEDVHEKLKQIYNVKDKELLEIFDRGGYGKEFCNAISDKIRFICWKSDSRGIPEIEKWEKIEVTCSRNTYWAIWVRRYSAWEREVSYNIGDKSHKFREVWIKRGKKVSPALTNDFNLSLNEVVSKLTRRWGVQENMFKELKQHGIDKIHSYDKERYNEDFLYKNGLEDKNEGIEHEVENPEVKKIRKNIRLLNARKNKILVKIDKLKKRGKEKEIESSNEELKKIECKIENLLNKKRSLPKKIKLLDKIKDQDIVRLCDNKKLFFDWLKMNAIWAKRYIIEMIEPYYKDLRDINRFVISILKSRTYVEKCGDELRINFTAPKSKKRKKILQFLCDALNGMNEIDLRLSFKKMIFGVREKH